MYANVYGHNATVRLLNDRGQHICMISSRDFIELLVMQNMPSILAHYEDVPPEGIPIITVVDYQNRQIATAKLHEVEHVLGIQIEIDPANPQN